MRQYYKSQNRLSTRLNSVAILILATIFMVGLISPASAKGKKVSTGDGIYWLELCRAFVDTEKYPRDDEYHDGRGFASCCSKEKGFCIECTANDNYCTKTPYFKVTDRWKKGLISPPSDQVIDPVDPAPGLPNSTGTLQNAPTTLTTE